jgi:hypothetical protein
MRLYINAGNGKLGSRKENSKMWRVLHLQKQETPFIIKKTNT